MPALALLLRFGLAVGALLPQLPELLRIVEQAGDALLAQPDVLALALPCQGPRKVPVVVFKRFDARVRAQSLGSPARVRCNRGECRNSPGRP